MPDGRVIHLAEGRRHLLRYAGRVTYMMAPAIERVAESFIQAIEPDQLVFDLRAATMLDSTNLGLMARLAARADRGQPGGGRCTIVSTNDDVTDALRSMGFEGLFDIVADHPAVHAAAPEEEIALEPTSQVELLRTMLEAHRVLADATPDEQEEANFRAVVEHLEAEMSAAGHDTANRHG
jgi:anti-anti-sigma regulatory factor